MRRIKKSDGDRQMQGTIMKALLITSAFLSEPAAIGEGQPVAFAATNPPSYPVRGPLDAYFMASPDAEIELARTAAPPSISAKADVLVLDRGGYRSAVRGSNGFVCMVWRSWSDDLGDDQFWNPKVRAPICLNPAAAQTVLPSYIERTGWVLSGLNRREMRVRFAAAVRTGALMRPAPGAMSYMMSRQGYLADGVGHAMPHIMFFVSRVDHQDWGANQSGSPIAGGESETDPIALFFVNVPRWSDGTPAMAH